jgi:hypothetical protein
MVTYIFRNLDDIVSIKEKEEGTIDDVSWANIVKKTSYDEFPYWSDITSFWDTGFDLEALVIWLDRHEREVWGYSNNKDDWVDKITQLISLWSKDSFALIEVENIFENLSQDSPLYVLLTFLKDNYPDIYTTVLSSIHNYKQEWFGRDDLTKILTVKSSRELHRRLNDLLEWFEPNEIEQWVLNHLWLEVEKKEVKKRVKNLLWVDENKGSVDADNQEPINTNNQITKVSDMFKDLLLDDNDL